MHSGQSFNHTWFEVEDAAYIAKAKAVLFQIVLIKENLSNSKEVFHVAITSTRVPIEARQGPFDCSNPTSS